MGVSPGALLSDSLGFHRKLCLRKDFCSKNKQVRTLLDHWIANCPFSLEIIGFFLGGLSPRQALGIWPLYPNLR